MLGRSGRRSTIILGVAILGFGLACAGAADEQQPPVRDPFAMLSIYDGSWIVHASHPWSGAPAGASDRLRSKCKHLTVYFVCEQTVNLKPQTLIVYTVGADSKQFNTRTITPDGLAGGRGDFTIDGVRWTYLDKPPASLKGPWSRVENIVTDQNHIRFEEYESSDEGKTWTQTNSGTEERTVSPQSSDAR